jgi:hypothetical protein
LDALTEPIVGDRRGNFGCAALVFRRRPKRRRRSGDDLIGRQGPGCEPDLRNAEPGGDLSTAMAELERPDRIGGRDVQRAVARNSRGPGIACDRIAGYFGPPLDEIGEAGLRSEAGELAAELVRQLVQE